MKPWLFGLASAVIGAVAATHAQAHFREPNWVVTAVAALALGWLGWERGRIAERSK